MCPIQKCPIFVLGKAAQRTDVYGETCFMYVATENPRRTPPSAKIALLWAKNIFQEVENPRCKKSELTGI
jgi:hypothetical protein